MTRWICTCGDVCTDAELLRAPSPFSDAITLLGCPRCLDAERMIRLCDVDGCMWAADCGTPTEAGYRQTCGEHVPPCHRDPEVRP